jgi:nucleoside-diphosphate-sugar epimerase
MKKKILVTGANGLVGTDLVAKLGTGVITSDLRLSNEDADVRDYKRLEEIIKKYHITTVYHLAGLLSAGGEKNPALAWDININGLRNILDLAVNYKLQIFWPSSIAAFGPTTPKKNVPQNTILEPTTIYGATKVAGELLCQYYFLKYGVDVRSLRYPGLIAWKAPPGDGTTEYSVHIFHAAIKENKYTCFLKPDTFLPMMYIDDAISGTIKLMSAPKSKIAIRTSYNFSALSFSPRQLVKEIIKKRPGFSCTYKPDYRQLIADSWPQSINDSYARKDWGWQPKTSLIKLVTEMFTHLNNDK